MEEKKQSRLSEFIKRDFWYILICLFALFSCVVTIDDAGDYQRDCNEHWLKQIENATYIDPTYDFTDFDKQFDSSLPIGPKYKKVETNGD